ncbi:DUF2975 domain-containing protein [Vibrio pelagius]|uniref:DUF2975 domain-containing protein n=1 Tax=Vibrio pelagius TaxID=28169 RepID=A0ABY5G4V0_VIBPE|nr:DUF2975 domain-containing protein [Vibrio pelagius]UTT85191.1 DUF2975 domain-containing protein [Vibrio pelagius]
MSSLNSVASLSNKVLISLWLIIFLNPISHAFLWFYGAFGGNDGVILTVNGEQDYFSNEGYIYGYFISNITMVAATLITWQLIKLFKLYKDGFVFTNKNADQYTKISYCILIYVLFRFIESMVFSWFYSPNGFTFSIEDIDVALIVMSVIVRLVAKVMHEANELYEEQSMTI